MANLTIAVDDELLKRARIRALEQGSSVNALLREFLTAFADPSATRKRAIRSLQSLADRAESGSGGRSWTRDELHER
ncbi:MAG: hypothetical protein GY856_52460 [bacterium]|nr:hypothetical protein [bacterium]